MVVIKSRNFVRTFYLELKMEPRYYTDIKLKNDLHERVCFPQNWTFFSVILIQPWCCVSLWDQKVNSTIDRVVWLLINIHFYHGVSRLNEFTLKGIYLSGCFQLVKFLIVLCIGKTSFILEFFPSKGSCIFCKIM
jgi:hypothetical protein